MEFVEVRGSTVDVAVEAGLAELGISRDDATITIIEEPAKGFLGIGSKTALVRIAPKPAPQKRRSRGRGRSKDRDGSEGRGQQSKQGGDRGRDQGGSKQRDRQGGRDQSRQQSGGQASGGGGRAERGSRSQAGGRGQSESRGGGRSGGQASGGGRDSRGGGRSQSGRGGRNQGGRQENNRNAGNRDSGRSEEPVNVAEQAEVAQDFLVGLLASFGLEGKVETRTEEDIIYATVTGEQTEALVGQKGSIMEAINELLRTIIQRKTHRRARLRLDIGGYNERRREALKIYTQRLAEQVIAEGGELMLEPMNPAERKVVHDAVAEIDGVRSFSEGEEPRRSVVIAAEGPAKADSGSEEPSSEASSDAETDSEESTDDNSDSSDSSDSSDECRQSRQFRQFRRRDR